MGLSSLVFLATHLASPPLALATVAGGTVSLGLLARELRRSARALDPVLLAICALAALGLMLLGGQGHLVYANDDWLIRDAVLADLVAQPWPVGYRYQGEATFLRAPLGLYLMPALAGKALGLGGAHGCLLAQNTVVFGGILYALASVVPRRGRALATLCVYLAFSGWDVLGTLLTGRSLALGAHLEPWNDRFQYSAHLTQLFWVPNHAGAGWLFAAAYLAWRRGAIGGSSLGVIFGFSAFWSPLSAIGALPFALFALASDVARGRLDRAGMLRLGLAGGSLLPVGIFLATDAGRVPHGFETVSPGLVIGYAFHLLVEVGPAVALLACLPRPPEGARPGSDMPLVLAVLLVVPLYKVGGADFVMRASIPALALLALAVAERVALGGLRPDRLALPLAVLSVGAVTPAYEVARALMRPAFAISACNVLSANQVPPNDGPMYHYVARLAAPAPFGLGSLFRVPTAFLRPDPGASCWPDRPDLARPG